MLLRFFEDRSLKRKYRPMMAERASIDKKTKYRELNLFEIFKKL